MQDNFLNIDIPHQSAFIRKEFLYNQRRHHGKFIPCVIFGLASLPGRCISFHCVTENGAQFARMPLHAFSWKEGAPRREVSQISMWDSFSPYACAHSFDYLKGLRVRAFLRQLPPQGGTYAFTIDWCGDNYSESTGDGGHKNCHIIRLDEGNYAGLPNNRLQWFEPSEITKPFRKKPDYITNTHIWSAENEHSWRTTHDDRYFYETTQDDPKPS